MSVLKFECPACGQHLECDRVCSGDIIHCPRCCAQIRIPFESTAHIEGSVARADLIAPAGGQTAQANQQPSNAPKELICPVCHAELRVPSQKLSQRAPPMAELVQQAPDKPPASPATPPDHPHLSIEERERQIAAAREAH